jgi:hypothetical protein
MYHKSGSHTLFRITCDYVARILIESFNVNQRKAYDISLYRRYKGDPIVASSREYNFSNMNSIPHKGRYRYLFPENMNNTFEPPRSPPTSAITREIQEWIAVAATIANIVVIIVYMSKKELREANLYIILLTAGDMLQGLGLALNHGDPGLPPGGPPGCGSPSPSFSLQDCSLSNVKTTIGKIGIQLQTMATVSIAVERFLAVVTPIWFNAHYNVKHKYTTVVVLLLLACL